MYHPGVDSLTGHTLPSQVSPPVAQPRCPRCGYDLSGPIPDWTTECPLEGTCPECGTGFRYADVFHPERLDVPWFIEHAAAPLGSGLLERAWTPTWATVRTFFAAALPMHFFTRLRVEHRIVPRRMLLWLLLLLLPLHLVASGLSLFRVLWVGITRLGVANAATDEWIGYLSCFTYPIFSLDPRTGPTTFMSLFPYRIDLDVLRGPTWVFMALAMHLSYAAVMLCLPWTRKLAQLRAGHIARALVYGLWWVALLVLFRLVRNLWLAIELLSRPRPAPIPFVTPAPGTRLVVPPGLGLLPRPIFLDTFDGPFMTASVLALVAAWWLSAMLVGWKLKQGRLVFALLTIIGLLSAACVAVSL